MGGSTVDATDDPREALSAAHEFLAANPIEHNLVLTLLHDRVAEPLPGRYWWTHEGDHVEGFVLQSPRTFRATTTPIPSAALPVLVDAVAADAPDLSGVMGEAATAARFAGCWTDRHPVAASPSDAGRLYRLDRVAAPPRAPGHLRRARLADRALLIPWADHFQEETGPGPSESAAAIDRRLREERLWVWEHGDVVSMALAARPVAGVVRVSWAYTPAEQRQRGYATACVAALSESMLATEAHTCTLYTELANPTSNAIYKRIGYRPVAEILGYRFDRA